MGLSNPWTTPPMTIPAAGAVLGLSRSASYRAAAAGDLVTVTLGGRRRVPVAEVYRALGLPLPPPPGTPRVVAD